MERSKLHLEELAVFMLAKYLGGLQGKEVPLMDLAGLLKFWNETKAYSTLLIMMALRGRFKGETGDRWHFPPIADITKTRFPVQKWFAQLLRRLVYDEGRQTGWIFQWEDGKREKFVDWDDAYKHYMARVQEETLNIIPETVDVVKDMSLWRSGRRGSTTDVSNAELDPVAIDANNRWRRRERHQGGEQAMGMREMYTQVENALPMFLCYSQTL